MASDYSFKIIHHNDPAWMAYISAIPEASLFHHPAWIDFLVGAYGFKPFVSVVTNNKGQIEAGLPILEIANFGGKKRWVSLPFTDHCAPLFRDNESKELLLDSLVKRARSENIASIELRWDIPSPFLYQTAQHVLTTTKLVSSENEILKSIQNFRNIRKAEEKGVYIKRGNSLAFMEAFYKIHLESRRRHGVPIQPWHFFRLLREQILDRGLGFISLAYKNGNVLSGGVYLTWNHTLTYKYAASTSEGRDLLAGDLLIWDAICYGIENGFKVLDWGRSDIDDRGLRHYKKRWCSEEFPLVYSTDFQSGPSLIRQQITSLSKQIIRHSPLWVCRLSGELLYKYFG